MLPSGEYDYNGETNAVEGGLHQVPNESSQPVESSDLRQGWKRTIRLQRRGDEDRNSLEAMRLERRFGLKDESALNEDFNGKYHLRPEEKRTIRLLKDKRIIRLMD